MFTEKQELYGLVRINYDKTILLPLDEAIKLLTLIATGKSVETDYSEKVKIIKEFDESISLKIWPEYKIKEMLLEHTIVPKKDNA